MSLSALATPCPRCSGISVGILVFRSDHLLLGLRCKPPHGWAPPAGHFEPTDVLPFVTAIRELGEETKLYIASGGPVLQCDKLPCTCSHGTTHHDWFVYLAYATGEATPKDDESKELAWVDSRELHALAWRTDSYLRGEINEAEWMLNPGLEPVWVTMLRELDVI